MTRPVTITTRSQLDAIRQTLERSASFAVESLRQICESGNVLRKLKFEKLGCDPLDPTTPENLAEQIDQQATHEVAVGALEILMVRHPGKTWVLAAGARGSGHDVTSDDGDVAAEVFAAVATSNNKKLKKDRAKVSKFKGSHKYVIFRSPAKQPSEEVVDGVTVISLGM